MDNHVDERDYKLLEKDTKKRLSAKEALNHPWFEKFRGRSLFCNFKKSA